MRWTAISNQAVGDVVRRPDAVFFLQGEVLPHHIPAGCEIHGVVQVLLDVMEERDHASDRVLPWCAGHHMTMGKGGDKP